MNQNKHTAPTSAAQDPKNNSTAGELPTTNDNEFETPEVQAMEVSMIEADLIHFIHTGIIVPSPWTDPEQLTEASMEGIPAAEQLADQVAYAEAAERLCVKLETWITAQREQTRSLKA